MEKLKREIQYETLVKDVPREDIVTEMLKDKVKENRILKMLSIIELVIIICVIIGAVYIFGTYDIESTTTPETITTTETYGFGGDFEQYNDNSSDNSRSICETNCV